MTSQLISRIAEPELMEDMDQARAYAQADFTQPHNMFVEYYKQRLGMPDGGTFLDLGCGTADITCRFAAAFPKIHLHGVDGSSAMLYFAKKTISSWNLADRIHLIKARLPLKDLPIQTYDGIISNSLLHHLHDPLILWRTIKRWAPRNAPVFIMDLSRPDTKAKARKIVETYSGNEADILKRDFFNSLLAAFRPDEIEKQLVQEGLDYLHIETVSDRHFIVWGHLE